MRDINEVLREREAAMARIRREIEALRIVEPLLADESTETTAPKMTPQRAENESQPVRKRWP
jgi:hypothetical protein